MIHLRDEVAADWSAREILLDAVFGADRFLKTSEALRAGRLPAEGLALIAEEADRLAALQYNAREHNKRRWSVATQEPTHAA